MKVVTFIPREVIFREVRPQGAGAARGGYYCGLEAA
jgi:hypothetical protein